MTKSAIKQSPAIVMWDNGGMSVLIPKKKGPGYLRCPHGHHFVEAISDIEMDEHTDACGLDGYLLFEFSYMTDRSKMDAIRDRIMPRLMTHYGFTEWREDRKAFWDIVIPTTPLT